MNDTFNPTGLDLTKTLHGHVRIETRDRWTGKVVDSQEKDNLITNMPQKLVSLLAWQDTGNNSRIDMLPYPIYSHVLGGILLFDSALTSSANNTWLPSNAKIVAMAGQDANSSSEIQGSYNATESVVISNGFTTVWDFLTSQANGTIASLARTHYKFATSPGVYKYDSTYPKISITASGGFAGYPIAYDEATEYLYMAGSGQTVDGVNYPHANLYKTKFSFDEVGLHGTLPKNPNFTLVHTFTSSDGNAYAYQYIYDKWANNFLYLNGTTLHIVEMDGTHSTKTLSGNGTKFVVTENYYWKYYYGALTRYSKTNTSTTEAYTISGSYLLPCENDIIVVHDSSGWRMLYPDGTIFSVSTSMGNSAGYDYKQLGSLYAQSNTINIPSHYLGTIANLDNPVTKTSAQTMKITYTLTEA